MMTSHERVLTACDFQPPDRIPRFDSFWEFPDSWRERLGPPESLADNGLCLFVVPAAKLCNIA